MGAIDHPARFSREELEGLVAVAIDLMNAADGDQDMEPNGRKVLATA